MMLILILLLFENEKHIWKTENAKKKMLFQFFLKLLIVAKWRFADVKICDHNQTQY